jgi:hypothetical protein
MHWRKYRALFIKGFRSSLTIGNFVRALIWFLCVALTAELLGIQLDMRVFLLCWLSGVIDAFISGFRGNENALEKM